MRDEDIAIYPVAEDMNAAWNGDRRDHDLFGSFDDMDWENAPAFVDVDVGTTDGSRVKFDSLRTAGSASDAYRKPMLSLIEHVGLRGLPPVLLVQEQWLGRCARCLDLGPVHRREP